MDGTTILGPPAGRPGEGERAIYRTVRATAALYAASRPSVRSVPPLGSARRPNGRDPPNGGSLTGRLGTGLGSSPPGPSPRSAWRVRMSRARAGRLALLLAVAVLLLVPSAPPSARSPWASGGTAGGPGNPRALEAAAVPPMPRPRATDAASPSPTASVPSDSTGPPTPPTAPTSSPAAPEPGTVVGTSPTQASPIGVAYDQPGAGTPAYDLVTNSGSNSVTILNLNSANRSFQNLSVGSEPVGIAWDSLQDPQGGNGYVYVANHLSNDVAVLDVPDAADQLPVRIVLLRGRHPSRGHRTVGRGVRPGRRADLTSRTRISPATTAPSPSSRPTARSCPGVVATLPVGPNPRPIAYDPSYRNVYVGLYNNSSVEVIHLHSTLKDTVLHLGQNPIAIACDRDDGYTYVAEAGSNRVNVLANTTLIGNVLLSGPPDAVTFDPLNGFVYVSYSIYGSDVLGVINGTRIIANVSLGSNPQGVAPQGAALDESDNLLVVADAWDDSVSYLSTALEETPASVGRPSTSDLPAPNPADSADVGTSLELSTALLATGDGRVTAAVAVRPSGGLGCATFVTLSVDSINDSGSTTDVCQAETPGNYSVWLNVSDSTGASAWARTPITVYADPVATTIEVFHGAVGPLPSIDVDESVVFTEVAEYGTGDYSEFTWSGLSGSNCTFQGGTATCVLPVTGALSVTVHVEDSNSVTVPSPTLGIRVFGGPTVATPTADRTDVDAGEAIGFHVSASGGPGTFLSYLWQMTPTGRCTNLTSLAPTCSFDSPGKVVVTVAAVDASDVTSARSALVELTVDPALQVSRLSASRSTLDVGQLVNFTAEATGGSGALAFLWAGLPAGCKTVPSSEVSCRPSRAGAYSVTAVANDSNGGESMASNPLESTVSPALVVAPPLLSSAPGGRRPVPDSQCVGPGRLGGRDLPMAGPAGRLRRHGLLVHVPADRGRHLPGRGPGHRLQRGELDILGDAAPGRRVDHPRPPDRGVCRRGHWDPARRHGGRGRPRSASPPFGELIPVTGRSPGALAGSRTLGGVIGWPPGRRA